MKGVIFKLLGEFVESTYGPDAFDDLLDTAELETTEPFVGPGNYPATDLLALVTAAVETHGVAVEDLLAAFGRFSFPSLAESVPTLLEGLDSPHAFLMSLESVIHTEVRKLDPEASPARFSVTEVGTDEILLHYQSPFGLFPLVGGFLDGVGEWYGAPVEHELVETDGTNGTFRVRFPKAESNGAVGLVDQLSR